MLFELCATPGTSIAQFNPLAVTDVFQMLLYCALVMAWTCLPIRLFFKRYVWSVSQLKRKGPATREAERSDLPNDYKDVHRVRTQQRGHSSLETVAFICRNSKQSILYTHDTFIRITGH